MSTHAAAADAVREEIDRIVAELTQRRGQLATAMVENIRAEIPPYLRTPDPAVMEDVREHCEMHAALILSVASDAREPSRGELSFAREAGVRRVAQGIPIDGLLAAFRVGHRTVWDAILDEAEQSTVGREAAIALARPAMEYIDIASTQVAESYTREEAKLSAAADRERRDLLESLLAGRVPSSIATRLAPGLEQENALIVAVAEVVGGSAPQDALPNVADALAARAPGAYSPLLVVVRQRQVVALLGTSRAGAGEVASRLRATHDALRDSAGDEIDVRIGVGTECAGLAGVAHGYTEATRALDRTSAARPVMVLQEVSAFEYLVASADASTREVILAKGRQLLDADAREKGAISQTLLAYLACDLNIRRAAVRLTVHPNTVRYRLKRIAELTDADPRSFSDLLELATVVRVARGEDPVRPQP
ncbi:MAG: PucR family transcriptional regulator [Thermoleophilaceae bacterium]